MAPCLVYAFMEGGSLQDRLACRGSGALVPLTANERMLVLSDVARGLAYLHSEVRVIHRDVQSANVLLDEDYRDWTKTTVSETLASPNPSTITTQASQSRIYRQSTSWAHRCTWRPNI